MPQRCRASAVPLRPLARLLPGLAWALTGLWLAAAEPAAPPAPAPAPAPAPCLDATRGAATVAANPAYSAVPLTVECRARLSGKATYNILIANELKTSATHWELFTMPGTGLFRVYLPGRKPDHVTSGVEIVDGQWHWLGMVLEADRCRLYVDGRETVSEALSPPATGTPGGMTIGALVSGELACNGQIAEVRLSSTARQVRVPPGDRLEAEADTVGLWHFDEVRPGGFRDSSRLANHATFSRYQPGTQSGSGLLAGGMSTALQPLPPPADTAAWRTALTAVTAELSLASVAPAALRDAVLREWDWDYTQHNQRDYPTARETWYSEPGALEEQALDRHALVWEADGGPLGTVLRRTGALLEHLRPSLPPEALAESTRDWEAVRRAATGVARDADRYRALYLAACAVRRRLALGNPLLDFDAVLFAARGTFAGSARSNPTNQDVQGGHFVTQYFAFNALPGGGLYIARNLKGDVRIEDVLATAVVTNGRYQGRKLEGGAVATPDLSFDGRTIVFAWTANREHRWLYSQDTCWHLFRVNVDGSGLTQLTDGAYNDFDPCWLPDGRIAFVSERRGGHIRCFAAYLKVRNYTLFAIDADGGRLVPLSYYETSEWNPSVDHDGRLVYTRWDYTDRENCLGTRFWVSWPDGCDPRAPHGNYPLPYDTFEGHQPWKRLPNGGREIDSRLGTPLVEMGIRAVPGSHRYLFTAAPHHGEVYGSLCLLDLRLPDDHHMSQVRRITPDEPFPESETGGRRHYKYGTPWPLSEDVYLCNVWENIVLLDRFGNRELLCDLRSLPCGQDERLRLVDPIPLRPRPCPPVLPPRTALAAPAAATPAAAKPATIAVMNVYDTDLPLPPGARIKWLRVTQNILKANHTMGEPMIGYERESTPRVPLGIVPVEADGSVCLEAPVAKELIFQLLDEEYMAVHSMRSVAFVHPGEQLSCAGCHEPTGRRAQPAQPPMAMRRAPSKLQPELGVIEPISYYRQVRPIVEGTCLPCHRQKGGKSPQDMSYEALRDATFWFSGAMWQDMCSAYSGVHGGSRTIPGRFGARNSRIGRALLTDAHRQAVPAAQRRALNLWLDSNSLRLAAYIREGEQLRGDLVWPELDVDPANPLGTETTRPGLRANFWHENLYGPHAFLGTSHTRKAVYVMDAAGKVVWEHAVPNPQDAWMLPDGHVLTTYLHGVREVAPDGSTVWEYTVEAPNELPSCQPLPDGRVLIGVVGLCRLLELDRQGQVVHQVQLETTVKEPHGQFRMCRKTAAGTYLVPFMAEGAVREYDAAGKVLREFPRRPTPVCALRLPDGNTLITADRTVTEYAPDDRIVWELTEFDVPDISLAILAGVHRRQNGNTVVCNWNAQPDGGRAGAHIFEVTPDKRVVWQVAGTQIGQVAQCQILGDDLRPAADILAR